MNESKKGGNSGKLILVIVLLAACAFLYINNSGGGLTLPSLGGISGSFQNSSKVLAPNAGNSGDTSVRYANPLQNTNNTILPAPQTEDPFYPTSKQFSYSLAGSCINGSYTVDFYYSDGSTARQDYKC